MKKQSIAIFLLAILLGSICMTALAEDDYRSRPVRYRNGRAFTMYAAPNEGASVLGTLPAFSVFTIANFTSIDGATWAWVILDDGRTGFITSGGGMIKNLRIISE